MAIRLLPRFVPPPTRLPVARTPRLRATVQLANGLTEQVEADTREGLWQAAWELDEQAVLGPAFPVWAAETGSSAA